MFPLSESRSECNDCMAKSAVFQLLTPEQSQLFQSNRSEVVFKEKEIIFKQGTPFTHVLILVSGIVKIYLEGYNFRDLIIKIAKPFEIIADPGMYVDKKHHLSVASITKTTTCMIEAEIFKSVVHQNRNFADEFIKNYALRSVDTFQKFISLTQKQMHGRIAESILYLSKDIFKNTTFDMLLSRQELADLSGLSKESICRILVDFNNEGIIKVKGRNIEIQNLPLLEKISSSG